MLKAEEQYILNRIIKHIYTIKTPRMMRETFLKDLKKLIPFKFSAFSLGVKKNKSVYLVDSVVFSDFEKAFEENFLYLSETRYDKEDYGAWVFLIPETIVYKDSEIVADHLRKKTSYYQDYLYANDLPYVAGISIVHNKKFLGAVTLYKTEKNGDFTEKDMFILNLLKSHLEARLADDDENVINERKNISYFLKSNYNMTSREIEIIGLIVRGHSNEEISGQLSIAGNTVKKHCSHIYEKIGVTNRSQLMQFILDNDLVHLWAEE